MQSSSDTSDPCLSSVAYAPEFKPWQTLKNMSCFYPMRDHSAQFVNTISSTVYTDESIGTE